MCLSALDTLFEYHEVVSNPNLPQWLILHLDNLATLRAILMDPHPPQPLLEDCSLNRFKSMAMDLESRISMFDVKQMDLNMAHQIITTLVPVLKVTSEMWEHPRSIFEQWKKPSQEFYPRTGQYGFVDHLGEYLEQLMLVKSRVGDDSVGPLMLYIIQLKQMVQLVKGRFLEIQQRHKEYEDLKNLVKDIANLAYEIEYSIDLYLLKEIPVWYVVFWLQDIKKELKEKIEKLNAEYGDVQAIISDILETFSSEHKIIATMNTIEINEKHNEIIDATAHKFKVCTWSLVSSYKERKKEVFLQLICNASFHAPYMNDLSEDELKELLHDLLKNKQYFIILKDVKDVEDFDAITSVLPDYDTRKSKILLTTNSLKLIAYVSISKEHTKSTMDCKVEGFKEETENMLDGLLNGPKEQRIISIAGMPGQGKTTLAKLLYNDPRVAGHFDVQAWVCVSQVYLKRQLLLELLSQVRTLDATIHHKSDEELTGMLFQSLSRRRFLIVLDDLWSLEPWNDLKKCFKEFKSGSRIIVTTRQQDGLISKAQSKNMLQHLNPLSDDDSWSLVQNKLFDGEKCPNDLVEAGIKIAKYCKGLPLSLVLTAGLLANLKNEKSVWEKIAENLTSRFFDDAKAHGKSVIELSYNHLDDHLKPCFLYFGVFVEDKEVNVQRLIRFWIAEGLIKHSELKSLEDVAMDYLLDLIGRSLIIVVQEKSIGGVKTCRVHDLLREFALTKAAQDNFFQQIQASHSCAEPITLYRRRLCIYTKSNHFLNLRAESLRPPVRSLQFFSASDMLPSDISFIFCNFKLLHILNLEDINIGNSLKGVEVLIHLRYLAVQGTMVLVPSSIDNLVNLETFCVRSLKDKVVEVPSSIWNIERLRHLHITGHPSFNMEPHRLDNSSMLDNLQTLSTPSLAYGDNIEKILRKLQGIRKLNCIFMNSLNDATKFPVLDFLYKLESLKVFYNGMKHYPCEFNFPSNLKKLTLTNFHMPWSEISQLIELGNLEALKLLKNSFEGETWEMEKDKVFPKLKFLKLDSLNVVQWIASEDNFPWLEHLLLHKCEQLKEIPSSIGDITTLLMIEVKWCSPSAAASALTIQEEQWGLRCEDLKINIQHKVGDSELSCM